MIAVRRRQHGLKPQVCGYCRERRAWRTGTVCLSRVDSQVSGEGTGYSRVEELVELEDIEEVQR